MIIFHGHKQSQIKHEEKDFYFWWVLEDSKTPLLRYFTTPLFHYIQERHLGPARSFPAVFDARLPTKSSRMVFLWLRPFLRWVVEEGGGETITVCLGQDPVLGGFKEVVGPYLKPAKRFHRGACQAVEGRGERGEGTH